MVLYVPYKTQPCKLQQNLSCIYLVHKCTWYLCVHVYHALYVLVLMFVASLVAKPVVQHIRVCGTYR